MKFLVTSYDDDQQQWFFDFVYTQTADEAVEFVCRVRPYCIAATATSLYELKDIARRLEANSEEHLRRDMEVLEMSL